MTAPATPLDTGHARDRTRSAGATAGADRRLFERVHRTGDTAAREALVERFLPLARHLARRYERAGEPLDDLVQVASVGLLKAIDRFDPSRATAFSTFAVPTILGELKRHFRDSAWSVRVPRDLKDLSLRVERAAEDMTRRIGRVPTPSELAADLEVTPEQVLEAREAASARWATSLDRSHDDEDDGETMITAVGGEDPGFSRAENAATIERLTRMLCERDRTILRLRFEEDLTQSQIGARLGCSQMQVSRLIRSSIERLRDAHADARPNERALDCQRIADGDEAGEHVLGVRVGGEVAMTGVR